MSEKSLPDGWRESDVDRNVTERYNPRPPILYESEEGDVSVQIVPYGQNVSHDDPDRWRVALRRGTTLDPGRAEAAAEVQGRDAAMAVARDLMTAYNEHGDVRGARDAVRE
ncbi:hypothetical protein ACFQPA_00740 [Halomarina halobia]|uniref:Uncharacterized protein n=1 Tax=Halomarina halobia TaxID=3033386 RepID=A0ABD6A700_9EURY|nr:hypothetical protein [Halomarina sp. PSR21]